jgi:putative transcription antitermination factor YqgF
LAWSNKRFSGKIMSGSRILALDYGTKRIGVALSDELGWTAQPLETFERRTLDRDVAHVASLVQSHGVREVVLGFPLQLDGREGPAVQAMRNFAVRLEEGLPVPLVLWDERLTTKAAEDLLIAADVSKKTQRRRRSRGGGHSVAELPGEPRTGGTAGHGPRVVDGRQH